MFQATITAKSIDYTERFVSTNSFEVFDLGRAAIMRALRVDVPRVPWVFVSHRDGVERHTATVNGVQFDMRFRP
jgi:hypothetical protein